jgi:hypothetical protein
MELNKEKKEKVNNNYDDRSTSWVTKFLWWCAGGDRHFLLKSPKQDRVKYAGIGGIVLATGFLAGAAGAVAFDTMFGPKILAGEHVEKLSIWEENFWIFNGIFGIIWGLIIFNLDRFIVSSTGKGDGTDAITWKEFGQAIPRIIIALILGFTISKPLEIKMLKSEIDVELHKKQESKLASFDSLTDAKFKSQIVIIDKDLDKLESERNVLVERQKQAEKEYLDQMQGRAGQQGFGPRAKQLLELTKEWSNKIIEFDKKNEYQINSLKSNREKKLKEADFEKNNINKEKVKKLDGLLARLSISHEIGFELGWAITLILLSIEMGPIIFKMMLTKGPYDYMVENQNHKTNVENGIFKEDYIYEGINGVIHMEKYKHLEVESAKFEKEKKIEEQNKITELLVKKWGERKYKDADENPDKYLKPGNESNTN